MWGTQQTCATAQLMALTTNYTPMQRRVPRRPAPGSGIPEKGGLFLLGGGAVWGGDI